MSICVVGSSNTDLILNVKNFPTVGETIVGKNFEISQGGKGANQAVSIAKLGGDATFLANVGLDEFGESSIKTYQKFGIKTNHIQKIKNEKTGTALIFINEKGENIIGISSGANACLNTSYIKKNKSIIQKSNFILTQLEIPIDSILYLSQLAKEFQIPLILNPAPAFNLPKNLMENIDILTPNETEASFLTGVDIKSREDTIKAVKKIHNQGVKKVLITLGQKGVLLSEINKEPIFIQAHKVKAIDTVGAGDTFNGAFVFALDKGKNFYEAAIFANKAAAIAVTKSGIHNSIPTLKEVESF